MGFGLVFRLIYPANLGNLFPLRSLFDTASIPGSHGGEDEDTGRRPYFRFLTDALADPQATATSLSMLSETCILFKAEESLPSSLQTKLDAFLALRPFFHAL